jgi:hypothetical protein
MTKYLTFVLVLRHYVQFILKELETYTGEKLKPSFFDQFRTGNESAKIFTLVEKLGDTRVPFLYNAFHRAKEEGKRALNY